MQEFQRKMQAVTEAGRGSRRASPPSFHPSSQTRNDTIGTMWAKGHLRKNSKVVWQILFCLTLLSFLFRSAVPVGYMPGMAGQHHQLTITLCTMDGASSVQLDDLSGHTSQSGHDGGSQTCPFCAVVSQAVAPGLATLPAVPAVLPRIVLQVLRTATRAPATRIGPPLGSRAPPAFLG